MNLSQPPLSIAPRGLAPRRTEFVLVLAAALAAMCLPTVATAQGRVPGLSVLAIESSDDPATAHRLAQEVLEGALSVEDVSAVDNLDTSVTDAMLLLGCSTITSDCLVGLAETLQTERLLYGSLSGGELMLTYFDAAGPTIVFSERIPVPESGGGTFVRDCVRSFMRGDAVLTVGTRGWDGTIEVDGEELGTAPVVAGDLSPGEHEVRGRDSEGRTVTESVWIDGPGIVEAHLDEPRGRARGSRGDDAGGDGIDIGWFVVGAGALFLGAATWSGMTTLAIQRDFDATSMEAEAHALADDGRRQATITNVLGGVGIAAVGAGIVLILTGREPVDEIASRRSGRDRSRVDIAVSPTGVLLHLPW